MNLRRLATPWLGPLMRQRAVCRGLILFLGVLGIAAWFGVGLWPCTFAELTGLPCPGCGLTRGTLALWRGDIRQALLFHPFTPFFSLVGALVAGAAFLPHDLALRWAARVEAFERRTYLLAACLLILIIFSLLRMLGLWYQPPLTRTSGLLFKWGATPGSLYRPSSSQ